MARPHYVAKRIGDQYVMVPASPAAVASTWIEFCDRPGLLVVGGVSAAAAVVMRGPWRWAMAGLGGAAVVAWAACHGRSTGRRSTNGLTHGPSFPRQADQRGVADARRSQPPVDAVEEASMESFPASDPPAHVTPTHAL